MLNSIEGFYRHGKVEFTELPPAELEGKVIVTFLTSGVVDLAERGIDQEQAADLRGRLSRWPPTGTGLRWTSTMPYSRGDVVLVLVPGLESAHCQAPACHRRSSGPIANGSAAGRAGDDFQQSFAGGPSEPRERIAVFSRRTADGTEN